MIKTYSFILLMMLGCTILNAQNVGIGIAVPAEKLHVAGNVRADTIKPNSIKITANAGNGKLLTSDAAGNASWQTLSPALSSGGNVGFGSWGDCSMNNISDYNPVADTAGASSDLLGYNVAMSGNFAIAGAPQAGNIKGSAAVFMFNGSNWILMQKLVDPNGAKGDAFGVSVAISGNFAVVGSVADTVGNNASQGSACIFQFNGTGWVFKQKITDPGGATGDNFGVSVSIQGNNLVVGSSADDINAGIDQGSASIFQFNGSNWVFIKKLVDGTGASGDHFGISTSISSNLLVVGAANSLVGTITSQGTASFYQLSAGNWVFMQKLTDSTNSETNQRFGTSVSLSGNFAIIGAPGNNVTSSISDGAAFICQLIGNSWSIIQKITDASTGNTGLFGTSVFISGDYVLAGAPFTENTRGAASVFYKIGSRWQRLQVIRDPGGQPSEAFGFAVTIEGATKRFMISAFGYGNGAGKAIFGKVNL